MVVRHENNTSALSDGEAKEKKNAFYRLLIILESLEAKARVDLSHTVWFLAVEPTWKRLYRVKRMNI